MPPFHQFVFGGVNLLVLQGHFGLLDCRQFVVQVILATHHGISLSASRKVVVHSPESAFYVRDLGSDRGLLRMDHGVTLTRVL